VLAVIDSRGGKSGVAQRRENGSQAGHQTGKIQTDSKPKAPGLLLISVGTMLTSMIAAGFILGYLVDTWLDSRPIAMLAFGVLGFIGGILKVYRLLSDPKLQ